MVLQRWVVPIAAPSSFLVQHNRIKAIGKSEWSADGIWVADCAPWYGEGKTGDFVISHNDITLEPYEGMIAGDGIETYQTEGAVISNNRVVGTGWTGIALWGDTGALVKGNNVENATAAADFMYPAPLCLMEGTSNCTVVGFGKRTNVYDEGFNNTIVGMNSMRGNPPGPAVREAMQRKIEMLKAMGKP